MLVHMDANFDCNRQISIGQVKSIFDLSFTVMG